MQAKRIFLNLRLVKGLATRVINPDQHVGKVSSYQLHHVNPIKNGGGVYDMNNIIITTPAYHCQFHVNKTKQKSEK